MHELIEFEHDGEDIRMQGATDATILFGYTAPFNEPFVAYGPFVMNSGGRDKASI